MNDHDRQNLELLMSLISYEDWVNWAEYCSDDDFVYAIELVKTAQSECDVKSMEMDEEDQDENGLDCSEAMCIIQNIMRGI